jgi:hypothetical protein
MGSLSLSAGDITPKSRVMMHQQSRVVLSPLKIASKSNCGANSRKAAPLNKASVGSRSSDNSPRLHASTSVVHGKTSKPSRIPTKPAVAVAANRTPFSKTLTSLDIKPNLLINERAKTVQLKTPVNAAVLKKATAKGRPTAVARSAETPNSGTKARFRLSKEPSTTRYQSKPADMDTPTFMAYQKYNYPEDQSPTRNKTTIDDDDLAQHLASLALNVSHNPVTPKQMERVAKLLASTKKSPMTPTRNLTKHSITSSKSSLLNTPHTWHAKKNDKKRNNVGFFI